MRSRGVTLVEVLVGIGLAGVLGGVASMRMAELRSGARLAGAVRTVATELRRARGRALAGGRSIVVAFDSARRTCEVTEEGGGWLASHALPPGVAFGALPARRRILFSALGTAENGTVTLAAGRRRRSVIVNQRGRVRLS